MCFYSLSRWNTESGMKNRRRGPGPAGVEVADAAEGGGSGGLDKRWEDDHGQTFLECAKTQITQQGSTHLGYSISMVLGSEARHSGAPTVAELFCQARVGHEAPLARTLPHSIMLLWNTPQHTLTPATCRSADPADPRED